MKTCTECCAPKPVDAFHNDKSSADGKKSRCADCMRAARRAYYQQNAAADNARSRQYKASERDAILSKQRAKYLAERESEALRAKAYRARNLDRLLAQVRRYKAENRSAVLAYRKQHHLNNPHLYRAQAMKRKAAKLLATPSWADEAAIKAIYQDACRIERETGVPQHVDHIVPLLGKSVCGLHVPWNLRVIPAVENVRKGNRFSDDVFDRARLQAA